MIGETFERTLLKAGLASILGIVSIACSEASGASGAPGAEPRIVTNTAAACGSKGQPDCPLQGWMKATVQTYLKAGDKERLATSLAELARHAPPGFDGWETAAKAGSDAAQAGDLAAVRAQCQACHQKNRARYRTEIRSAKLF
jgi:hypothetical protein